MVRPFSCGKLQRNISSRFNLLCKIYNEGGKHLYICPSKQGNWSIFKCSSAAACLVPPITTLTLTLSTCSKSVDHKRGAVVSFTFWNLPVLGNTGLKDVMHKHIVSITKFLGEETTHLSIWGNTVQQECDWGAGDMREWGRLLGYTVSCHPEGK